MRKVVRKALRCSVDVFFGLSPRGRSEAGLRVSEMRKAIYPSRDRSAMQRDFCRVGEYLRFAMVKHDKKTA